MIGDELEILRRCFVSKFNEEGFLSLDRLQFELNVERAMFRGKATLALLELIADHFKYKWHDSNSIYLIGIFRAQWMEKESGVYFELFSLILVRINNIKQNLNYSLISINMEE